MSAPIIHRGIQQGSPQWFGIKAGMWSASKAAVVMGGLSTGGLAALIDCLAWERLHGPSDGSGYKSAAMERGNLVEPQARDWYANKRGVVVDEVGFVIHATLPTVGWSPDGLIGTRKGIEAKCPLDKAWLKCQHENRVPAQYRWQTRWGMWVGQLDELDFIAYHPTHGGLIVPCEVTDIEIEQMADRIALLEPKVAQRMEQIGNASKQVAAPSWLDVLLTDPEVSF